MNQLQQQTFNLESKDILHITSAIKYYADIGDWGNAKKAVNSAYALAQNNIENTRTLNRLLEEMTETRTYLKMLLTV